MKIASRKNAANEAINIPVIPGYTIGPRSQLWSHKDTI